MHQIARTKKFLPKLTFFHGRPTRCSFQRRLAQDESGSNVGNQCSRLWIYLATSITLADVGNELFLPGFEIPRGLFDLEPEDNEDFVVPLIKTSFDECALECFDRRLRCGAWSFIVNEEGKT